MDDQHNRCSYVCGVYLQRCILKKFHKENDCLCVADRYGQLDAENAQLKVALEVSERHRESMRGTLLHATSERNALKAALIHAKQAEQQIREHEFQRGYQEAEAKYKEASCESPSQSR